MAHLHRFFISTEFAIGAEVTLTDEEAHHALHVVRVRAGDAVALINGRGAEALGRVSGTSRHEVRVACEQISNVPKMDRRLTLVQAALHNPKASEYLVRHGTEIGVSRFIYFRAQHSERAPAGMDKLARTAVEAMKQSGRRWLPELLVADDIEDACTMAGQSLAVLAMDASPTPLSSVVNANDLSLFIGPEGDFAAEEIEFLLTKGAAPVSLGDYTYRSEVAGVLAASLVQYQWGQLGPTAR